MPPNLMKGKEMLHDPRHDLPEWKRILLRAHEIIEERGWCQQALQTADGRVCLEAAISIAAGGAAVLEDDCDTSEGAARAFDEMKRRVRFAPGENHRLWVWNDRPGRTKDEVLKLIRMTVGEVKLAV
jgi:hypothetical protein